VDAARRGTLQLMTGCCTFPTLLSLALFIAARLTPVGSLPKWANSEMPDLRKCAVGDSSQAKLNSRFSLRKDNEIVVEWVKPNCAIGGTEIRVDAFLRFRNKGEIGLGEADCKVRGVELKHELNNTWGVYWFLLNPGTYTICHRERVGRGKWTEQTKFYILQPTAKHCSYISDKETQNASVACEFPPDQTIQFFDGFLNEETRKPNRCVGTCDQCLEEGGNCKCQLSKNWDHPCHKCWECEGNLTEDGLPRCECITKG